MSGINPEIEKYLDDINNANSEAIKEILNYELQNNSGGGSSELVQQKIREIIDSSEYDVNDENSEEVTL